MDGSGCDAGIDMTLSLGSACKDAERDRVSLGVRLATSPTATSLSSCLSSSKGAGDGEGDLVTEDAVGDPGG